MDMIIIALNENQEGTQYRGMGWKTGMFPRRGCSKKSLGGLGGDGQMEGMGQNYQ